MQSMFRKLILAAAISGLSLGVYAQATYTAPASPSPSPSTSTSPSPSTSASGSAKVDADYEAAVSKCDLQTGVDRNVCLDKARTARDKAMNSGRASAPAQGSTPKG